MEIIIFAFLILLLPSALGDSFLEQCKTRIEGIKNGTETYGPINNETIDELGYLYHGPVEGINSSFPREKLLTVTKNGCKVLCGTDIDWYWLTDISLTLGIVSNWVIPITALLAVLPYEASQYRAKNGKWRWLRHLTAVTRTLGHLCNWLGSPQTVLTAIFFNIYQMKMCLCAARLLPMRLSVKKPSKRLYKAITGQGKETSETGRLLRMNAFYLLSCISQFELPEDTTTFLEGLLYGLLKPVLATAKDKTSKPQDRTVQTGETVPPSHQQPEENTGLLSVPMAPNGVTAEEWTTETLGAILLQPLLATTKDETSKPQDRTVKAEEWTTEILDAIARQMRYSRRRGVWATFISIFLFFIAYAVSVTLAFSNDLGDRTTTHSLAYGILISWLPLLVLFAIVDRNPNCADRTRTLLFRWMWNVRAINDWETDEAKSRDPKWWSPAKKGNKHQPKSGAPAEALCTRESVEHGIQALTPSQHPLPPPPPSPANKAQNMPPEGWDATSTNFIGQGRKIGYNGLAFAVLSAIEKTREDDDSRVKTITRKTRDLFSQHTQRPPQSWWVIAVVTEMIVLTEVGMAVMMSSTVPTVGVGCRSGLYIAYGLLSTFVWLLHLFPWFRRQEKLASIVGFVLCLLGTLCLLVITFASFSGVFKNCVCRAGLSGYLDFEGPDFYKNPDNFNVAKFWWIAPIVGAVPVVFCFFFAFFLFYLLRPLWQGEDEEGEGGDVLVESTGGAKEADKRANMGWLV